MLASALAVQLALAAASPPEVVLGRVQGEGMSEADTAASKKRIEEELLLMGAQPVDPEAPAEAGCFDDAVCVTALAGERPAVLHVELLRVGPLVQVTARLYDARGAVLFESDRSVNAEGVAATGTLLGPEIAPHIRALEAPAAPGAQAEASAEPSPAPPAAGAEQSGSSLFVPLLAVGGTLAVVGVVAALTGGVIAAERTATAYTPQTPGEEKAVALAIAPWATGVAVAGLAIAACGAGVLAAAFVLE